METINFLERGSLLGEDLGLNGLPPSHIVVHMENAMEV